MEGYETAYKVLRNVFVFLFYCVLFIILAFGAKRAYRFGYEIFADESVGSIYTKDYPVTVTESMTDAQVANLLAESGLIRDKKRFLIKKKIFFPDDKFLAGNYILNNNMTMSQLIQTLTSKSTLEEEE